ncbi:MULTISPECIES: class I lanthipeptide [Arcicella]|uniref:Class I lanthipeptide n=1 Tax=Arcicella aquatica TaxID=217141 RepID=A0ABU5QMH7_9BACT|nr:MULTISPECIES: class I lanthipeptide [Arcicella]MDR6562162.1 hypothetical protein [Arcicella sp. BE51]MDR6812143.1 hypothetical protein [Arcicella sp. BE140]MDR6823455.1 hypothetical protein [Arcicella sp. BE139]MEA5257949.1 class I lanthipeptide [Arcicella aquatica]
MKKKQITFDKKLSLDREIVGKLDAQQMDAIAGGSVNTATCIGHPPKEALEAEAAKSCDACSCNH